MRESKLHKWLSRLDKGEQNAFVRYVEALGGKNRDELGRMARLFVKKVVRGKGISREAFYAAMGWKLPYNAAFLQSRLTDLKKKLEVFLAMQELRRDAVAVAAMHMRAISRRGWADFVKSEIKATREILQDAPVDVDVFLRALEVEEAYLRTTMESARKFKDPPFQVALGRLDELYCLQKLRYACAAHLLDQEHNLLHQHDLLEDVVAHLEEQSDALSPILRLYFHTYQMLKAPAQHAHFQALRTELEAGWQNLSGELAREFYKYLISHCIARMLAGDEPFVHELVRIYETTMESGVLLENGLMNPGELKNMISMMIRIDRLPLAEQLLETYGPKLTPDADPVTIDYNRAILLYHQGEYSRARKMMEEVVRDAEDVFFKLDAKIFSWRASYELGDTDLSEDNYNSLRMYLQRDKHLSKVTRERYMHFVNSLNSLWRIISQEMDPAKRKHKLQGLLSKLDASQGIANILWLRKKVVEELAKLNV